MIEAGSELKSSLKKRISEKKKITLACVLKDLDVGLYFYLEPISLIRQKIINVSYI